MYDWVVNTPVTSVAFGKRCEEMGVRPSMGTVGDAYDNAMAESFFTGLECELINRRSWKSKTVAVMLYLHGLKLGTTHTGGMVASVSSHPIFLKGDLEKQNILCVRQQI